MGYPSLRDSILKDMHDRLLSYQVIKPLWSPFSCKYKVTHISVLSFRFSVLVFTSYFSLFSSYFILLSSQFLLHSLYAAREQLAAAHRKNAYRCFLPDLTRFTPACCAGPLPDCIKTVNNVFNLV